jgi:hypothetical protein
MKIARDSFVYPAVLDLKAAIDYPTRMLVGYDQQTKAYPLVVENYGTLLQEANHVPLLFITMIFSHLPIYLRFFGFSIKK